jgi:hypothetical protein
MLPIGVIITPHDRVHTLWLEKISRAFQGLKIQFSRASQITYNTYSTYDLDDNHIDQKLLPIIPTRQNVYIFPNLQIQGLFKDSR